MFALRMQQSLGLGGSPVFLGIDVCSQRPDEQACTQHNVEQSGRACIPGITTRVAYQRLRQCVYEHSPARFQGLVRPFQRGIELRKTPVPVVRKGHELSLITAAAYHLGP